MCTHYGLTHVCAHALHVCVCTHTRVCRAHEPTAACSRTTDARLLAHACAHTSPRLLACATAAQHQQRCQSTQSACCLLTNPPSRRTRVCTHVCMHVSHMRSSNAAMQQCSSKSARQQCSNAAAMQQQCSNAAMQQQCSNATMQQQCRINEAAMPQCSNAAAMQQRSNAAMQQQCSSNAAAPQQCSNAAMQQQCSPPSAFKPAAACCHHTVAHSQACSHTTAPHTRVQSPGWGGACRSGGWGRLQGVFWGGGGFASATVTASLIFVASEKWGRAVVSPREPAAHDGRPPLLL